MHAWMCVCECICMCSCFDQQLKFWTCNRLSVVKFPLFLFNFFFVVVFMPASAPSSLPLSDSFLLHVFIKLFLNFAYPFFPTFFFDEVLSSLLSLCPSVVCFYSYSHLTLSLSVLFDNEPLWPHRLVLFYRNTTQLKTWNSFCILQKICFHQWTTMA